MKVNKTELDYHVDYLNKKIHLLDKSGFPGQTSLTNSLDPDFKKSLIAQESLLQDVLDFDWICYSCEGFIALYTDFNFKMVSPKLPYLHEPFLKYMQQKRKDFGRG